MKNYFVIYVDNKTGNAGTIDIKANSYREMHVHLEQFLGHSDFRVVDGKVSR